MNTGGWEVGSALSLLEGWGVFEDVRYPWQWFRRYQPCRVGGYGGVTMLGMMRRKLLLVRKRLSRWRGRGGVVWGR